MDEIKSFIHKTPHDGDVTLSAIPGNWGTAENTPVKKEKHLQNSPQCSMLVFGRSFRKGALNWFSWYYDSCLTATNLWATSSLEWIWVSPNHPSSHGWIDPSPPATYTAKQGMPWVSLKHLPPTHMSSAGDSDGCGDGCGDGFGCCVCVCKGKEEMDWREILMMVV